MKIDFTKKPWNWLFYGKNDPATRSVRLAQALLLGFLLISILFLIFAKKPWDPKITQRIASGKNLTIEQVVVVGLYIGVAINTFLATILYLTARWWALTARTGEANQGAWNSATRLSGRIWWILLLFALLTAGALRWNLAHGSLWWDENWNLTRAVLGERIRNPDNPDQLIFKQASWKSAFFYYAKPTNHVVFSITSKACLTLWQKITNREPWEFDEFVFRFPNFLAALAAVAALAWLLRDWGYPIAGLVAAWLLALHPWHIRYGIDARAFSKVALISILSCWVLVRAFRSNRWRYWIGFGLSQWLLLWAFPYAIYLSFTLATGAVIGIFRNKEYSTWSMLGRCFVGLILGAMAFIQCMTPNTLYIARWDGIEGHGRIGLEFIPEIFSVLVSGMPWADKLQASGADVIPSLQGLMSDQPWIKVLKLFLLPLLGILGVILMFLRKRPEAIVLAVWMLALPIAMAPNINTLRETYPWLNVLIFLLLPLCMLLGIFCILKQKKREGLVLIAWLLAIPVAIWFAWGKTSYFYPRYVIYGLPAVIASVAIAVEAIPRFFNSEKIKNILVGTFALCLPVGFWGSTAVQREVLMTRSYSPEREVAEYMERLSGKDHDSILACGFGLGGETANIYNPWIWYVDDKSQLLAMMERSRTEEKPMYLFYGYNSFNRRNQASAFAILDNKALFTEVNEFYGIESQFTYKVFRYSGETPAP